MQEPVKILWKKNYVSEKVTCRTSVEKNEGNTSKKALKKNHPPNSAKCGEGGLRLFACKFQLPHCGLWTLSELLNPSDLLLTWNTELMGIRPSSLMFCVSKALSTVARGNAH